MSPATCTPIERRVLGAIGACLADANGSVILAVSGGLDSMALLDAALRVARARVKAVATFDHRSGDHARQAVAFVKRQGRARGVRVLAGAAATVEHSEAAWRTTRWTFLRDTAREAGADVMTAHTLDDQLETVCMRVLRGSGARGIAGLYADSPILRPFLGLRRSELVAYAGATGLDHLDDPTNASTAFLRNRLRRDLLPAIARVQPGFSDDMIRLARDAAALRRELDQVAERIVIARGRHEVSLPLAAMQGMSIDAVAALAPSLATRAGIVLDRRGTTRLSQFILKSRSGTRVQLSGGGEAVRIRDDVVIRRTARPLASNDAIELGSSAIVGPWRFQRIVHGASTDAWVAELPADRSLTVRGWRAGDRMRAAGSRAARRVKRFFSDAGIAGPERLGWPVVLADGEIVWIPGVRRSDAATDRSGRPVLRYRCERNDV